jgi:glycosyltransferase involved in cell wall biosynthesis
MDRIILSAFACDPSMGSEPGYGWSWASGIAHRGFEVHCFTRNVGRNNIEKSDKPANLHFHYVTIPLLEKKLYQSSTIGMYLYYLLWQWFAYRKALEIHKQSPFHLAHHVTWGSIQLGSFMYKLGIPFVFGPAGGGQKAPPAFKAYFGNHWQTEEKREKIASLLAAFNPACKKMLRSARVVLVSNPDTAAFARQVGAVNVISTLDAALPNAYFPDKPIKRKRATNQLKLLWTGRFLPRKGILLLLEVMHKLRDYHGITLTVVGDGEMRQTFLDKLTDYQLAETVNWVGKVPYEVVKGYYATHDVFFFTSLRESGGVQLVEAMAYGMPIVTLNLHGQAVVVNDETGFRCECPDPETAIANLKAAILALYQDSALLERKSKGAYAFSLQQTWDSKINMIVNEHYALQ